VSSYDQKQLYSYFNTVKPSLIRVEADELTYNFHIAMRYELEKKLLEGEIKVSELPLYGRYDRGLSCKRPEKDADGVLQDVHWSWDSSPPFLAILSEHHSRNAVGALTKKGLLPIKGDKSIAP